MMRKLIAATLAGLLAAGTAAAQEVKIGVLYPIKTMLGQQGRNGAELAAEMINADGGVLPGRPMKLIVYDDNYQPACLRTASPAWAWCAASSRPRCAPARPWPPT